MDLEDQFDKLMKLADKQDNLLTKDFDEWVHDEEIDGYEIDE
jgi:hypothetical protein